MTDQPWIEKYRPKQLDDVSSQTTTTNILKKSLKSANLPHMLFYGPPGTGKTSTILALANELYGQKLMHSRVLELNASDERGISIVRERIKTFARLAVSNPTKEDLAKYPCPPYKLIILDEADSMTADAQAALRRTMENYASVTRFCLICNYVTKIIDPLASRCTKFRFKNLDLNTSLSRLNYINEMEKIDVKENVLKDILDVCEGDLRRSVNLLQCVSTVLSDKSEQGINVKELFGYLPDDLVINLVGLIKSKKLNDLIEFTQFKLVNNGYSASFIIKALHENLLLASNDLSNSQKIEISKILWESDLKVSTGCNENIQILSCVFKLSTVM